MGEGQAFLEQLVQRNAQRFRCGLVFEARRLCVSLNSRLETDLEEKEAAEAFRAAHPAALAQ